MKDSEYYATGERVALGMEHLDRVRPGWEDRIDLETLDIGVSAVCAVGQLEGSFAAGLLQLDIDSHATACHMGIWARSDAEYQALTEEWAARIRARRKRAAA